MGDGCDAPDDTGDEDEVDTESVRDSWLLLLLIFVMLAMLVMFFCSGGLLATLGGWLVGSAAGAISGVSLDHPDSAGWYCCCCCCCC